MSDSPVPILDRAIRALVYIAGALGALTAVFALFLGNNAALVAAVVLCMFALIGVATWLVTSPPVDSRRSEIPFWVRASTSGLVVVFAFGLGAVSIQTILNRDTTKLSIRDVRYSLSGETIVADIAIGVAETSVITKVIYAQYFIDPDSEIGCGGHDYEEISVGALMRPVRSEDGNLILEVDQKGNDSDAHVPVTGERTQVGGCSDRVSMTLRPQTPATEQDPGLLRLILPTNMVIEESVLHSDFPELWADSDRHHPGDSVALFIDPNSEREPGWEGWRIFNLIQIADDAGNCDRRVDEVTPESGVYPTSSDAVKFLMDRASTERESPWVEECD